MARSKLGNDPFQRGAALREAHQHEEPPVPVPPLDEEDEQVVVPAPEPEPEAAEIRAEQPPTQKPLRPTRNGVKKPVAKKQRPRRARPVFEGEVVDAFPPPKLPASKAARQEEDKPEQAPGWFARARELASSLAGKAVQRILASTWTARGMEAVMSSPVTHRVAGAAVRAASATRPALDLALRLLPPARSAVASVVSGQAARTVVTTAAEAGAALRQAAATTEPAGGEVDAFGEDPTVLARAEPVLDFLHDRYFRIEALDPQQLPKGACLLVCNHSGVLPIDGPMIRTVLRRECNRLDGRWLVEDALFHAPFLGTLLNRLGAVRACPENAERLLAEGVPLAVFPEGLLGISKPVSRRYQLQRFGRGGFVKLALRARVPIVPVAIVGAEEASPLLAKIPMRSLGFPYLPVTPTFPFLGPLGLLPFPTKWTVSFLPPLPMRGHKPEDAEDPALVARLTAEVKDAIQKELDRLVAARHSLLSG